MDNTELHLGLGTHRLDRLWQSLQPVDTRHKAVSDAAIVQLRKDRKPEFGPLSLTEPQP